MDADDDDDDDNNRKMMRITMMGKNTDEFQSSLSLVETAVLKTISPQDRFNNCSGASSAGGYVPLVKKMMCCLNFHFQFVMLVVKAEVGSLFFV